jgi:hypothetical protein
MDAFVYILIDAFTLLYFSLNLKYMRFNFEIEHIVKRWNHKSNLEEYRRVLDSWLFTVVEFSQSTVPYCRAIPVFFSQS